MYWAITLYPEAKSRIMKLVNQSGLKDKVDNWDNWKLYCDHITIAHPKGCTQPEYNAVDKILQMFEGRTVLFKLTSVGISENAIALGVDAPTLNAHSHITIAIKEGHTPKESNEIKVWEPLWCLTKFEGIIQKCD